MRKSGLRRRDDESLEEVTLELGDKSAAVVFEDANLDSVVREYIILLSTYIVVQLPILGLLQIWSLPLG